MLSVFDQGPPKPCPTPFNLAAYVLGRSQELGEKPALEVVSANHTQIWTFAQLEAAVRGMALGLSEAGFKRGDILLMRLGNTVVFPIA